MKIINGLGLLAIILAAFVSADGSFVGADRGTDVAHGGVVVDDGDVIKQYGPVSIDVYCKGVNWKSLTAREDDASAGILMQAYNIVHQQLDNGDYFLAKVHFQGINMEFPEEEEDEYDDNNNEAGMDVERRRRKPPPGSPNYNGGAGCRFCRPGNDADAKFVDFLYGGPSKSLVAWEKKFEEMLKQGPHSALHGANKCNIAIWPMQDAVVVDKGDDVDDDDEDKNLRGGSILMNAAAHTAMTDRTTAE